MSLKTHIFCAFNYQTQTKDKDISKMTSVCKIGILKKLDETPTVGLFVSIPKFSYQEYDRFMETIFDRFPHLKSQPFYIFYCGRLMRNLWAYFRFEAFSGKLIFFVYSTDSDNDKVIISTASDYRQFWEQNINKIFIVMGSSETSCFEVPPPSSDVPSNDTLKEHFTKENERFKTQLVIAEELDHSTTELLGEIREMIDKYQETGSKQNAPVSGIEGKLPDKIDGLTIEPMEVSSIKEVQGDERVVSNDDTTSPDNISGPSSAKSDTDKGL